MDEAEYRQKALADWVRLEESYESERQKSITLQARIDQIHIDLARQANALQARIADLEVENQALRVQLALLAHGTAGQVG